MSKDHEWLNLIEVSGPFLAVPVLRDVFPQGLEAPARTQRLRRAYDEWRDAVDQDDIDLTALHRAWIDEVMVSALEMDDQVLRRGGEIPERLRAAIPEHGVTLSPDLALMNPTSSDDALLLIDVYDPDVDLDASRRFDGLAATPAERMVSLLRATGCPIGLVINGERWMLVHAPVGSVASFASWYARLWAQEPETLRAFVSLLGVRRFFGPDNEKLPALFERSLKHQDDVTDALGEQVRRAVEVLVQALDRADQDRNRELLRDVDPRELYEAGLTIMMRLVFLLAAEERGLLLLGDPRYDSFYATSSLRMQLRADSEEILERRRSAWSRLLALFRAIFGGIEHPTLRLPAFGGSLFDPDRYPFLEGRNKGTSWRSQPAEPLPIDDRTVLLLLEAIQTFEGRTLSYRALDVEQIGHVYEGLLERTVKRVDDVTLELDSAAKARSPRITLGELESARLEGTRRVVELLKERSERSEPAIHNNLERPVDDHLAARLLTVCRGDASLRDRILPYGALLRADPWGYPLVHHSGAFVVVLGADRRESGTHYTPKSLTEKIVQETIAPIVYRGPEEGRAREEWELKGTDEILDLKICDPAMGSGAFLVEVCRWVADRLVEAWAAEEEQGELFDPDGARLPPGSSAELGLLSGGTEERTLVARRLVAERCLYGVDRNPLAVELAKLSLWLITLAKGRPFGFLDHNLRSGDSLLGIQHLDQLLKLDMRPTSVEQLRIFGRTVKAAVERALELRGELRAIPIRDVSDIQSMAVLDDHSRRELNFPERIADRLVSIALAGERASDQAAKIENLAAYADVVSRGDPSAIDRLLREARRDLAKDAPDGAARRPLHWPLEFPEVFQRENPGFDAFVGNPPFLGGQRITGALGTCYRDWLVTYLADGRRGSADLVAYFFLRLFALLRRGGGFGLLAVNTIAEGDTRQVGLEAMVQAGAVIHSAYPNEPWPGAAAVATSRVHVRKGDWRGDRLLRGKPAPFISAFLSDREEWSPKRLKANDGIAFQGCITRGLGFVITQEEARRMLEADRRNADVLFPYLNGEDLNSDSEQRPSRWSINFWDWPESRAASYTLPYRHVLEHVKPDRFRRKENGQFVCAEPLREAWWLYEGRRTGLFHAIGRGRHFDRHPEGWDATRQPPKTIMVCSEVTKHLAFAMVPNTYVMSANLDVFSGGLGLWLICQSSIHEVWARTYSSKLETRLKYSPGNAFETFPLPRLSEPESIVKLGEKFHEFRRLTMISNEIGLTRLYNRIHAPDDQDSQIEELRQLQIETDLAVMDAYGWTDLNLEHDFRDVPSLAGNDRLRFAISEPARLEVLRRLSELNRRRFNEEVAQGLHGSSLSNKRARNLKRSPTSSQVSLFAEPAPRQRDITVSQSPQQVILDYLQKIPGWHAKAGVLSATGLADAEWNSGIGGLLSQGAVERLGERRGARYRYRG
ncbi:Eco57I restriction-modification methylase domain-containing protein [Phenylobacterium sp. 58.2.17]|uniref:Eco57I restriction-modification methylase domain-containing protein n=1 Tax=Phenylobacterium sp. 58.2.17 TaxID=2969306 RepID=UPI0022644B71|nr:type IIL restriction-modification enzyme MmeI [Phenylobacterium sp. 58.2.17]MCX7584909.1 hypothetical protein [Phenylobacterium sp. 58.2.17]